MFNITYYLQKCGTAMGTQAAPVMANYVMGYLELKICQSSLLKFNTSFHSYLNDNRKRYLDGFFILWNDSIKLLDFKIMLNDINSNI